MSKKSLNSDASDTSQVPQLCFVIFEESRKKIEKKNPVISSDPPTKLNRGGGEGGRGGKGWVSMKKSTFF